MLSFKSKTKINLKYFLFLAFSVALSVAIFQFSRPAQTNAQGIEGSTGACSADMSQCTYAFTDEGNIQGTNGEGDTEAFGNKGPRSELDGVFFREVNTGQILVSPCEPGRGRVFLPAVGQGNVPQETTLVVNIAGSPSAGSDAFNAIFAANNDEGVLTCQDVIDEGSNRVLVRLVLNNLNLAEDSGNLGPYTINLYRGDHENPPSGPPIVSPLQTPVFNFATTGANSETITFEDDSLTTLGDYTACVMDALAEPFCVTDTKDQGEANFTINIPIEATEAQPPGPGNDSDQGVTDQQTCEGSFAGLGWLLCQVAEGVYSAFNWLIQNVIVDGLMEINLGDEEESELREVWGGFRTIANLGFVIAFLIIIYAQATGAILDAYSIKRMLPRLGLAVIGVQLSFFIAEYSIDTFNLLGRGIGDLVLAPVDGFNQFEFAGLFDNADNRLISGPASDIDPIDNIIVFFGLGAAGIGLLFVLPTILLAGVIGLSLLLITLIFRRLLIIVLLVTAPIAFVAWVLPNTERLFRLWWDTFLKALVMYPLIVLFIAAGQLMGRISILGDDTNFLNAVIGFIATFLPLFLIPATFRFAGAAITSLASAATNVGEKIKGDIRDPNSLRSKFRARRNYQVQRRSNQFVRGFSGNKMRDALKSDAGGPLSRTRALGAGAVGFAARRYARFGPNLDIFEAQQNAEATEEIENLVNNGKDGYVYALVGNGKVDPRTGEPLDKEAQLYAKRHRKNLPRVQASLAYAMRKAGSSEDLERLRDNFQDGAKARGFRSHEITGAWIAASFRNQNEHGELKHQLPTKNEQFKKLSKEGSGVARAADNRGFGAVEEHEAARYNPNKAGDFVQEALEKKGSYAFTQQLASYWEGLDHAEARVQYHQRMLTNDNKAERDKYMREMGLTIPIEGNDEKALESQEAYQKELTKTDENLGKFETLRKDLEKEVTFSRGGLRAINQDDEGNMYTRTGAPINASRAMKNFLRISDNGNGNGNRGGTPPPAGPRGSAPAPGDSFS